MSGCQDTCAGDLFHNSACDEECNTSECDWDNQSCVCDSGCTPEDLLSEGCDD